VQGSTNRQKDGERDIHNIVKLMQRADDEMSLNSTKLNEKGKISNICCVQCNADYMIMSFAFFIYLNCKTSEK